MLRTTLLIEGWRGVNHSFATVNQCQILELLGHDDLALFHHDVPFQFPSWSAATVDAGFDADDTRRIAALADLAPGARADFVLRIASPFVAPQADAAPTLTFIVTELGLESDPGTLPLAERRHFTRDGHRVITPSRWSADRLAESNIDRDRIVVIPHGVRADTYHPLPAAARQAQRSALGYAPEDVIFLNLGAPFWNKGLDLLVQAFARVRASRRNARLLLKNQKSLYGVGIEELLGQLPDATRATLTADVLGSIRIIDTCMTQQQLRVLYAIADRYVSPYRAEGFNLPVLEAIACGVPAIVTAGGATDDFCNDDVATRISSRPCRREGGAYREPSQAELVDSMVQACDCARPAAGFAAAASDLVHRMTWAAAADRIAALARGTASAGAGTAASEIASLDDMAGPIPAVRPHPVVAYCDGGFGNRFNALVSGILVANAAGRPLHIVWPRNNWCRAALSDVFDPSCLEATVEERELLTFAAAPDRYRWLIHEDRLDVAAGQWRSPLQMPTVGEVTDFCAGANRPVFLYTPLILPCFPIADVLSVVRRLRFRPVLLERAQSFLSHHNIDQRRAAAMLALQIRKTDFGANGADDGALFDLVRRRADLAFFVCSDDPGVERRFEALPNVLVHDKTAHVEKRVDGDWNALTSDESGRLYPCNVERGRASVLDAVVDLLLLARFQIVQTSGSTFLQTAVMLRAAGMSPAVSASLPAEEPVAA